MKKMSEAKILKPGPKRKLSDSARKRNKQAANAKLNKNRILNIDRCTWIVTRPCGA
jgi:hypothetical protein